MQQETVSTPEFLQQQPFGFFSRCNRRWQGQQSFRGDDCCPFFVSRIARLPLNPDDVISEIYMALEPGRFAVKSYLHLTTMADPQAFVQILLHNKWFYINVP